MVVSARNVSAQSAVLERGDFAGFGSQSHGMFLLTGTILL